MEREEVQLWSRILSVPSNVELVEPLRRIYTKKELKIIIRKREQELEKVGFQDQMERLRVLNLISILYASIGKTREAMRFNDMALEIHDKNVNALACRAWYHLEAHAYYISKTYIETLNEEKINPFACLVSKAEVAFACSKLGMDMYSQAEKLFTEVLEECKQSNFREYDVCNWKFSLAQTIRRQLDIHNTHDLSAFNDRKRRLKKVIELFLEIDDVTDKSVTPVRAKTLVELGLLIEKLNHAGEQVNELTQDARANDPKSCFERALELHPKSVFVLERSGTFFRLIDDVDRSLGCLEKALKINETSYAHHHFALTLLSRLNKQLEKTKSKDRFNLNDKKEIFNRDLVCFDKEYFCDIVDRMETLNLSVERGNTESAVLHHNEPEADSVNSMPSKLTVSTENAPYTKTSDDSNPCSVDKCSIQEHIDVQKEIEKIIVHLDKSYRLNNNWVALLQKGILLKKMGQFEEAVDVFKSMFNDKTCSLAYLASAYEEAAFCNLQIRTNSKTEKSTLEHDAKIYLRRTIEISCMLIAKDPSISSFYAAFPTLKSMVLGKTDVRNLRELGTLSRKLRNYSEALGLFKKALEHESGEDEKKEVLMDLVKLCLQTKDYDDAIVHLKMIGCLPHASDKIDRQVYITAHIKGALLSWINGEKEMARQRIEDVMNCDDSERASAKDECSNRISSESGFHVYVLSSEASEAKARKLSDILQDIGLRVTLNSDDVMPGSLEKTVMLNIVERSKHIALFLGEVETENDLHWLQIFVSDRSEKVTVITESNTVINNAVLNRFPCLRYTDAVFGDACSIHEDRLSWVEEFLFMVADTKPIDLTMQ